MRDSMYFTSNLVVIEKIEDNFSWTQMDISQKIVKCINSQNIKNNLL